MDNKEKDNKIGQEASSIKRFYIINLKYSFIRNYFLDYFLSNPKLHVTINHSRIYSTYLWLVEIINILLQFLFFNYT